MQITVVYDPSVAAGNFTNYATDGFRSGAAEEAAFKNAINYVVNLYDALFTNNTTFTIDIGWGEDGQQTTALPSGSATGNAIAAGGVATNLPLLWPTGVGPLPYSTIVSVLKGNEGGQQAAIEANAYNALPANDPLPTVAPTPLNIAGSDFYVTWELAQTLGLATFTGAGDAVGFGTTPNFGSWYFGTGTPAAGQTDFIAAAEHEISEGMGRLSFAGTFSGQESILDLFRYSSSGARDLTPVSSGTGNTAYFSIDGGVTSGGTFNNDVVNTLYSPPANYDLADWAPGSGPGPGGNDAFANGNTGVVLPLTLSDLTVMNVLGWNLSFASNVIPNGVTGWVPSGKTASGFVVQSGGFQDVGGIANSTTISNGGSVIVSAGGTVGLTTVSSGGFLYVSGGGTADSAIVGSGGNLVVSAGGHASGTFVSGGTDTVYGQETSATVDNGVEAISSGGASTATRLNDGGGEQVYSAATTTGTSIYQGGTEDVNGGVASGTTLSGGTENVSSGGSAVSAVVVSGTQSVYHGGTAIGTVVGSDGAAWLGDHLYAGGVEISATISSGGFEYVWHAGTASRTTIDSGGNQTIYSGGTAVSATVGGEQDIGYGGSAGHTVVKSGGLVNISSGGVDSGTTIDSGGKQVVVGSAAAATIDSGGFQWISSGGVATSAVIAGGHQDVFAGGSASGSIVKNNGVQNVNSGGTVADIQFEAGTQNVRSGAIVSGMDVANGTQNIFSGGTASNTTVDGGSLQYVSAGGDTSGTTIKGHSIETVIGLASGTVISLGMENVYGESDGTTVLGSSTENVEQAGVENAGIVRGGTLDVLSGGTLSGTTTISGGTLELAVGAAADGPIDFAGGGTLRIDGTVMPGATISGLATADVIDLAGVSFVSGASVTVLAGNVMQITVQQTSYDLQLETDVNYYSGAAFTVFGESQPGTYVTLGSAPLTSGTIVSSGQVVSGIVIVDGGTLTVEPGGTASGVVIDNGGIVYVSSGGNADGTIVNDGGNLVVLSGGTASGTVLKDPGLETISAGGVSIDATLDGGEQYVSSGGTASGATVSSASDQYVYQGGTASNTTVDGGVQVVYGAADGTALNGTFATQFVYGSASATTIGFESYEYVETGGADSGTIVGSAGLDFISSGGVTSGSEVMNGGNQYIYGSANNTTVDGGGVQSVQSGGVALNTLINGTGDQFVYSGGTASNTTADFGDQIVYGTAVSTTLSGSFATEFVYGAVAAITLDSGSYEYVESGGADSGTVVGGGGLDTIYFGGATSGSEVMSGGNQYIYGSAIGTTVDTTGVQTVESGGSATGTAVASNGFQYVSAAGMADDTTVNGGKQVVYGTASDTTVSGSFATQFVYGSAGGTTIGAFSFEYVETGGFDSGTVVGNDGQHFIYAGGVTVGAEIQSGGDEEVYGSATSTTVDTGGGQNVDSGGTAIATQVGSAGDMNVSAGGTASGAILDGGAQAVYGAAVDTTVTGSFGAQFVYGSATGTTVGSGSYDYVESGGADSGTFVSSGGLDLVYFGGKSVDTAVAGGEQDVLGSAIGTTIDGMGLVHVYSGGTTEGATIDNGSVERVDSGGTADGTTIAGGSLRLAGGASLGGAPVTFMGPGGTLTVGGTAMPGNTISGFGVGDTIDLADVGYDSSGTAPLEAGNVLAVLEGGQTYELNFDPSQNFIGYGFVLSTDSSSGTDITLVQQPISSAGAVSAGETVSGVSVASGGSLDVLPGGTAIVGTVSSGGTMNVSSGASTDGVTIADGGYQYVLSGGTASNTIATDPGIQIISAGGSSMDATLNDGEQDVYGAASGTIVGSGGREVVFSGGTDSGTAVNGGGGEVVSSGGTASDTMVDSGGALEVLDGGTLAGYVVNDGTVDFDLASSASFGGTLVGGGTLEVSGGGALDVTSTYIGSSQIDDNSTLEFAGTYVGIATFSGSSTGPGGTLKFDAGSIGPINVVNPNDTVIAQPGSNNWINAAVSYVLPSNIDALFLYAGAQGTGNGDAVGNALYALDAGNAQTLTGNSPNDTFVVYNSSDVVVPGAGSHDAVYAAVNYTLPAGVDTLILEGTAAQGVGNSDAAGDGLYAANPDQVATLIGNSGSDTFVVYNSSDVVVPKTGSHDVVYSAASYTLPTGVDVLIMEAGTQAVGNSDAAGDALYAANPSQVATLIGNSLNDTFVVYNSADVVVPKAGSHDLVYSAVDYALPTGVDSLILEGSVTQAIGNSDASGDTLYAANPSQAATLIGNSHNDTFVVYNSADTVIGQANSTDTVYAAANFTLPTNVDTLFLEGSATQGTGNSDAVDALFGNAGFASTLVAGSGADILSVTGTAGTIMTGGAGADNFAFPDAMGQDEVTNFGIAKDTLQFNASLFANFSAAMQSATQVGANTVFTIDGSDSVTLDNVTKSSLAASNFHFS